MATTRFITISGVPAERYWKELQTGDSFIWNTIRRKVGFMSRKSRVGLSQRSLLPIVAEYWAALTDAKKLEWKAAGALCGLTGWRLYVKDTCAKIINDIVGTIEPSLFHQAWVGQLHIGTPATELKIIQLHPRSYWVQQKVVGKKGTYVPVVVTEDFALPLKISLFYRAEMLPQDVAPKAQYRAEVWSSYQGQDIINELIVELAFFSDAEYGVFSYGVSEYGVDIDNNDGWLYAEATLSTVLGYVVGYDLYLDLVDLQGELYIDNIKATHSSQNWVRDPYCQDINQGFTRAFYQVPKHWVAVVAPVGTFFETTYKKFNP